MEISSNGYKIPVDTDTSFFDYLVYNFNRLNSHKHDGVDSDNIPSSSVTRTKQEVLAEGGLWEVSGAMYVQTIELPDPYTFDNSNIHFVDTVSGEEIHPKYVKIDATSFDLYSPYSTSVWEIWYG